MELRFKKHIGKVYQTLGLVCGQDGQVQNVDFPSKFAQDMEKIDFTIRINDKVFFSSDTEDEVSEFHNANSRPDIVLKWLKDAAAPDAMSDAEVSLMQECPSMFADPEKWAVASLEERMLAAHERAAYYMIVDMDNKENINKLLSEYLNEDEFEKFYAWYEGVEKKEEANVHLSVVNRHLKTKGKPPVPFKKFSPAEKRLQAQQNKAYDKARGKLEDEYNAFLEKAEEAMHEGESPKGKEAAGDASENESQSSTYNFDGAPKKARPTRMEGTGDTGSANANEGAMVEYDGASPVGGPSSVSTPQTGDEDWEEQLVSRIREVGPVRALEELGQITGPIWDVVEKYIHLPEFAEEVDLWKKEFDEAFENGLLTFDVNEAADMET